MQKLSQYIMYALMIVGIAVFVMAFNDSYDPILYVSYLFFGLCIAVSLVATVAGLMANPESIKSSAIGLIGMAALLGISYGMASDTIYEHYGEISASTVKLSGMGLYAFYVLFGGAVASIVFSAVMKMIR